MQNDRGPQPTLTGAHVRLRPWRAEDVDAVFAACQDAEIQRAMFRTNSSALSRA